MTDRLYYTEPERRAFRAVVTGCATAPPHFHVTLDATAFYPTSGGQPFDTGQLGEARVVDVIDRDDDVIVHVVDRPIAMGTAVEGTIDWPRRFDHMQQHTGQHILSAAFDRLPGAHTTSFHLGADGATIDLAREVQPAEIARAEAEANRIVWDNRPVTIRFAEAAEAARLPLRKEPARAGRLRLIDVTDFDLSACGGTHVPATGVVGIIAVTGWERFKGGSRIGFVCGGRALAAHGRLRDVVAALARRLSAGAADLDATVARLQDERRERLRQVHRLQDDLAVHRGRALAASAQAVGGLQVVLRHEPGLDGGSLKTLAAAIVSHPGLVAVLVGDGGDGEPAPVVIARSADGSVDASVLLRGLVADLGGRGGGRPELAQGGIQSAAGEILARLGVRLAAGDV
ncbi:MAG TPA: DHHA1 domain-containing protein [Vicinamibacterales bacterium]|nr:DHHA1 domain-containing protein [Vicinamibacterales bacterium]